MAKRREDFIRARREEKRKEREEQMKRGLLSFYQFLSLPEDILFICSVI